MRVPTHTGEWQQATVKCYGSQSLNEIEFSRGKGTKVVRSTANHRWLLKDGTETTELKIGHKIIRTPKLDTYVEELMDIDDAKAWVKGFVFGDGQSKTISGIEGSRIQICGTKIKHAHIFEAAGYSVTYPPSLGGNGSCYMKGEPKASIDPYTSSLSEIRAFCHGYCAADAGHRHGKIQNIQATGKKYQDVIETLFDVAGLHIGSYQDLTEQETNYGKRTDNTKQYTITRPYSHQYWKVTGIKEGVSTEDVWCLEVETDHSFILQGGLVTGNCMLIDVGGMLKSGFKMGNADIETPKSISTACAITAQIIAQVASHIYGGNTINGIDVILAPYVKASWDKHHEVAEQWEVMDPIAYANERTEKECYDAFQALEYEVNTLHTANG